MFLEGMCIGIFHVFTIIFKVIWGFLLFYFLCIYFLRWGRKEQILKHADRQGKIRCNGQGSLQVKPGGSTAQQGAAEATGKAPEPDPWRAPREASRSQGPGRVLTPPKASDCYRPRPKLMFRHPPHLSERQGLPAFSCSGAKLRSNPSPPSGLCSQPTFLTALSRQFLLYPDNK